MPFKIGFTGSLHGMTDEQKRIVKAFLINVSGQDLELHHGDCVGADAQVDSICRDLRIPTVIHPPINSKHRAFCDSADVRQLKPYLERNHDIVDETDLLIAAPQSRTEVQRSGTWATIRYAQTEGKKVSMALPHNIGKERMSDG
ncbi:hypothetical protein LCGC14_2410960 [marine sediment metagenome]|uniref:DUF2493 domain-containing protein n=1 Tax=marine sediment metagenome TaxID=412755 RepID=A0A0F9CEP4_9ZZZZ